MDAAIALFLVAGLVFGGLGVLSLTGRLPRNGLAGVRIAGATADDKAWRTVHRASGPWMIATGAVGFLLAGVFGVPWLAAGQQLADPNALSNGFAVFLLAMAAVIILVSRRALRAMHSKDASNKAPWDR